MFLHTYVSTYPTYRGYDAPNSLKMHDHIHMQTLKGQLPISVMLSAAVVRPILMVDGCRLPTAARLPTAEADG